MRYFYLEQFVNEQKDKTCALDKCLPSVYALVKETARRFSLGNIEVNATPNDLYLAEKYDFLEILGETAIYKIIGMLWVFLIAGIWFIMMSNY